MVLAVGCVAPPDAACRYAGGSCRAADSINGTIRRTAGVAGQFTAEENLVRDADPGDRLGLGLVLGHGPVEPTLTDG